MSRKFNNPFDDSARQGFTNAVLDTQKNRQGTKYNHVGSRSGLSSMLDSQIIERNAKTENQNFGDGFISFTVEKKKNAAGNLVYPPMNIGGRLHYPNDDGKIVIVDSAILDKELAMENERREYIKQIIERASISNSICSMVLGQDASGLLSAGRDGGGSVTDAELVKVDALPESIETLDTTSQLYSRAIQKFKIVIKAFLPIIDNMTTKAVQNEGI